MNPLNLLRTERQKQIAEQEAKRSWAAAAVHRHLAAGNMARPRQLWTSPTPHKALLAVVNVPRWPLPKEDQPTVRFLDLAKLANGDSQWLRRPNHLPCPITSTTPEDACIFAVPPAPHLKILCLTPAGWADCFRRLALMQTNAVLQQPLDAISRTLKNHGLPFRGLIITSPENLSLPPSAQNSKERGTCL